MKLRKPRLPTWYGILLVVVCATTICGMLYSVDYPPEEWSGMVVLWAFPYLAILIGVTEFRRFLLGRFSEAMDRMMSRAGTTIDYSARKSTTRTTLTALLLAGMAPGGAATGGAMVFTWAGSGLLGFSRVGDSLAVAGILFLGISIPAIIYQLWISYTATHAINSLSSEDALRFVKAWNYHLPNEERPETTSRIYGPLPRTALAAATNVCYPIR